MKAKSAPKLALALLLLTLLSCEDTIINNYTGTGEEKTYSIEGYAQKGPFIIGSNVTVSELSDELYPTGRVFFATILDNKGHFELPGVVLTSPYIQIKVEGSYFSEVSGGVPVPGNLTLYSLADINDTQTINININIFTHLEKERVEYLVQNESKTFSEAKEQALEELLTIFNLEDYTVNASEDLTILSESEGNAVLLTVSSVIEGILDYERRLALITNFQEDFQDGMLSSTEIQNTLLTSAYCLDTELIIDNITDKFSGITIPDFEPVLEHFIDNSEYTNHFSEIFVRTEEGSINLLSETEISELDPTKDYVLFIKPPQGILVGVAIELDANYASEGSFDASSSVWTESNVQGSCTGGPDPVCVFHSRHRFYATGTNLNPIEIPITSFSDSGILGITFQLSIDGFYNSKITFSKNFTW